MVFLLVIVSVIAVGGGVYFYELETSEDKERATIPTKTSEELENQKVVDTTENSSVIKKEDQQETTNTKILEKKPEQRQLPQKSTPPQQPIPTPVVVMPPVAQPLPPTVKKLLPPPQTLTKPIPNVLILEVPENDPSRYENGVMSMNAVVQKFYEIYPDEFDMLVTFDVGKQNNKYNGWSNGFMRRYVPSNIGQINECSTVENMNCSGYPTRLRYIQQFKMWDDTTLSGYVFVHELGHYWGVGWGVQGAPQCFDSWASYVYDFPSGHWSSNFEAGPLSVIVGGALQAKNGTYLQPRLSRIIDNKDGTFTTTGMEGITNTTPRFNYIDLYAMGLMTEEELATKDMFIAYDLERKGSEGDTFYGVRKNITLDNFKTMLKQLTACMKDPQYNPYNNPQFSNRIYYTGDGSRILNSHDNGKEFVKDFKVAFIFMKYPEQTTSNKSARDICQAVNYDYPKLWNDATYGLSTIRTYLSEASKNPDCATLFPPHLD